MIDSEHDIELIAAEIHRYLLKHPNAADTLEGITKWWLCRLRFEEATVVVQRALEHLVATGIVEHTTNKDNQRIYRKQRVNTHSRLIRCR